MGAPTGSRIRRVGSLVACLALIAAVTAPSAFGVKAHVATLNGVLTAFYIADPGETNHLTATVSGGAVTFQDPGIVITTGAGHCTSPSRGIVTCSDAGIKQMSINLDDGQDSADNQSGMKSFIDMGTVLQNEKDTADGGSGRDIISGGGGPDLLSGNGGNDEVYGDSESDTLWGDAGDDLVVGESGSVSNASNTLYGGTGSDTLISSQYLGGFGQTVVGGPGQDYLYGAKGPDFLNGGDGVDLLNPYEDNAPDAVIGGPDKDVVDYLSGNNHWGVTVSLDDVANDGPTELTKNDNVHSDIETIWGSNYDDYLVGGPGPQTIQGFDGYDGLDGGSGPDDMYGGDGYDQVTYRSRVQPVKVSLDGIANDGEAGEGDNVEPNTEGAIGGRGDDTFTGNDGFYNFFYGGPGADTATGLGGHDQLSGEAGPDTLNGGDGEDQLEILGGPGSDTLNGGPDDDTFWMGPYGADGPDTINGGGGTDTLDGSQRSKPLDISLNGLADDGEAGEGDNVSNSIEAVIGGSGPDTISGNSADNTLGGRDGKDTIKGFAGDDEIAGGDNADDLFGGADADVLHAVDGFPDTLSCGSEVDKYGADSGDTVNADCETALP